MPPKTKSLQAKTKSLQAKTKSPQAKTKSLQGPARNQALLQATRARPGSAKTKSRAKPKSRGGALPRVAGALPELPARAPLLPIKIKRIKKMDVEKEFDRLKRLHKTARTELELLRKSVNLIEAQPERIERAERVEQAKAERLAREKQEKEDRAAARAADKTKSLHKKASKPPPKRRAEGSRGFAKKKKSEDSEIEMD